MYGYNRIELDELIGKTFTSVRRVVDSNDDESIVFEGPEGSYAMYHSQDCCESVYLVDFDESELSLLENSPILYATEDSKDVSGQPTGEPDPDGTYFYTHDDLAIWTFYNISTNKGTVNFRWYGSSNGYYSVDVTIVKLDN